MDCCKFFLILLTLSLAIVPVLSEDLVLQPINDTVPSPVRYLAPDVISTISFPGANMDILNVVSKTELNLKLKKKVPNWFLGIIFGVDTEDITTLCLNMSENSTSLGRADVGKWEGLRPVYTYGSHIYYSDFIYYTKGDDGFWVSSDPFLFGNDKLAGNDRLPVQEILFEGLEEYALSEDGKYWSAWMEIEDAYPDSYSDSFTMRESFKQKLVTVAIRVPYSYDYEWQYMLKLKEVKRTGVKVHEIGKSVEGRDLYIVEINDPKATEEELKDRRVVLIYANEDGDEPDSSWVTQGIINFLISDSDEAKQLLKEVSFLCIPMLDPDGWAHSTYGELTYSFAPEDFLKYIRPEAASYASFINSWCGDRNMRLDLVVNLHNIECNEGPNVMFPLIDINYMEHAEKLNDFFLKNLTDVKTSSVVWAHGSFYDRFSGWCQRQWGSIITLCEINSRYPQNRLSLKDMDELGKSFALLCGEYFKTDAYEDILPRIEMTYEYHKTKRNNYLSEAKKRDSDVSSDEYLISPSINLHDLPPLYTIIGLGY